MACHHGRLGQVDVRVLMQQTRVRQHVDFGNWIRDGTAGDREPIRLKIRRYHGIGYGYALSNVFKGLSPL